MREGIWLGVELGILLGLAEGLTVSLGLAEGLTVLLGLAEGFAVGSTDGPALGRWLGSSPTLVIVAPVPSTAELRKSHSGSTYEDTKRSPASTRRQFSEKTTASSFNCNRLRCS